MSASDAGRAWRIRAARNADCPQLPDIERSAAQLFHEIGWGDVAEGEVTAAEAWEPHCADETLWVAVDDTDQPIAFLASGVQASILFIYELAVKRDWQRQGVGRALLSKAANYAAAHALSGVGLTAFCDVAWNGQFYAGEDYAVIEDIDLPLPMRQVIAAERARWPQPERRRCAMIKTLPHD